MLKFKRNQKGGATIVAVMIMIMLIAIGTAIMVVTGRGSISDTDNIPAYTYTSENDSSDSDLLSYDSNTESSVEDSSLSETTTAVSKLTKSEDYHEISIDSLTTKYGILVDAENNQIIAGKNYNKKIYPASLTKIMTLIVAVENADDKDATYKFNAKLIDSLVSENASLAGFEDGETVSFEDLLYSSILVSGADATSGLADIVAGSESDFVDLMNQKCEELGLTGTHFENASGLHSKNHYSTCEDLAVIMQYALDNKECRDVLKKSSYTTSKTTQHPNGITFDSILASRLQGYYIEGDADIMGGKTGFTDESLFSLATYAEKDKKDYICVTVKSSGGFTSIEDNIAIYEKYLPTEKD